MVSISEAFAIALSLHQAGNLADAELVYRQIIAADPDHTGALNNLALIVGGEEAIALLGRMAAVRPDNADGFVTLGSRLKEMGRLDEAISCFDRALVLKPDLSNIHLALISALQVRGRFDEMEAACRRVLTAGPYDIYFSVLGLLGSYLEQRNRADDAIAFYEQASRLAPGNAYPETRRRLLLIRRQWGPPPAPAVRSLGPYIAMSSLGNNGRFGNQVIQYSFLRTYAHVHGLGLEVPDWIGRDVFGLDDPYIGTPLPFLKQADIGFSHRDRLEDIAPDRLVGWDLIGGFNQSSSAYRPHQDFYRSLFTFSEPARRVVDPVLAELRRRGGTLVVIHLRRGDHRGLFWIAPEAWYVQWLEALWPTLERPVLFIATDEPELAAQFTAFSPLTGADFPAPPAGVEFLVDYAVMIEADILATSNSSFSDSASLLNRRARLFARPARERDGLIPYDPWDAPDYW